MTLSGAVRIIGLYFIDFWRVCLSKLGSVFLSVIFDALNSAAMIFMCIYIYY
ncbi:hypothetical protein BTN50_1093 [Candidatus Enterovibrio altilux]|uniref:Uncharacterized protein n=1 Tax=Candidatus Enterovibrio altilux TaxID=1927128 RepID=A0A291B9D0_9GAMM|nr:hypothetical protein BTN50_1093 [Candidatus Enterovibrio luxaltus]